VAPPLQANARPANHADASFPFEQFPALNALGGCRHVFTHRIPGVDVSHDKAEVLQRLDNAHSEIRRVIGVSEWPLLTAQQVHGNQIAIVDLPAKSDKHFPSCDGFITNQREIALGIYVADCCAVYIIDPITPAIGLVHSGKKGTELKIAARAIEQMKETFGSNPEEMIVQLSPCIRPPHYEIDFAAEIIRQCRSCGVSQVHDTGTCTACDLNAYYSYRAEKGKTGRMLALLGLIATNR
jgi:copper oxidase (laccase) domain-containing protein